MLFVGFSIAVLYRDALFVWSSRHGIHCKDSCGNSRLSVVWFMPELGLGLRNYRTLNISCLLCICTC